MGGVAVISQWGVFLFTERPPQRRDQAGTAVDATTDPQSDCSHQYSEPLPG